MNALKEYLAKLEINDSIVVDPVNRLRRLVTNINSHIESCGAEIDGEDALTKEQAAKIKLKIPECLTETEKLARIEAFAKKSQEELKQLDVEFI